MTRTARAGLTVFLAGLLVFSVAGTPAQAAPKTVANAVVKAAAPTARITIGINGGKNAVYASGEKFWLRGKVLNKSGHAVGHQKIILYSYVGSKRKTLVHLKSNAKGNYSYWVRPFRSMKFKAQRDSLVSPKVTATRSGAPRTLAVRQKELAYGLGAAKGVPVTTSGVTYRKYAKGTLVQTGARTWLVRGALLKEYLRLGGVKGKLGAPASDEKCRLKEGACLQRFAHGTIYTNKHAKDRATYALAPGANADLVATALSQVGYTEPQPRKSKYSKWIHRTGTADAWCGYFAAWSSVASGHGSAVIKAKTFAGMVKAEKKRHRLTKKPAIGRLAYIDYFRNGKPTHVGIVTKFNASSVWTVDGNVSAGGGSKQPRGVHIVKRSRTRVVTYANPRW